MYIKPQNLKYVTMYTRIQYNRSILKTAYILFSRKKGHLIMFSRKWWRRGGGVRSSQKNFRTYQNNFPKYEIIFQDVPKHFPDI
jgi:hypothetical protein